MMFDRLEDRRLLSASASSGVDVSTLPTPTSAAPVVSADGTLTVTGTTGDDRISVRQNSSGQWVVTEIVSEEVDSTDASSLDHHHGPDREPTAYRQTTITDAVSKIVVNAGDGNDDVIIGRYRSGTTTPTTLNGGAGNDHLFGGVGIDTINGDAGNDEIFGGGGNDLLNGGADNDRISGGQGDDTIHGDAGDDVISGDAGVDSLYGDAGADRINAVDRAADATIDGGADADTAVVDSLDQADTASTPAVNHVTNVETVTVGSNRGRGPGGFGGHGHGGGFGGGGFGGGFGASRFFGRR